MFGHPSDSEACVEHLDYASSVCCGPNHDTSDHSHIFLHLRTKIQSLWRSTLISHPMLEVAVIEIQM